MAKKNNPAPPPTRTTYTARAKDLKILGYVEARTDKEALLKARKQYGAATVERRDTAAPAAVAPAAAAGTKAPSRKKGDQPGRTTVPPTPPVTPTHAAEADGVSTPTAPRRPGRKEAKSPKRSALDAAVRVLQEAGTPLSCQEMIAAMAQKGYWTSPQGRTPSATLYSAILRELNQGRGGAISQDGPGPVCPPPVRLASISTLPSSLNNNYRRGQE